MSQEESSVETLKARTKELPKTLSVPVLFFEQTLGTYSSKRKQADEKEAPDDGKRQKKTSWTEILTFLFIAVILLILTLFLTGSNDLSLLIIDAENDTSGYVRAPAFPTKLRLPRKLWPTSYKLRIKVYLPYYVDFPPSKNLTFEGEVIISFSVKEETDAIVLNQYELNITKAGCSLRLENTDLSIRKVTVDDVHSTVTIAPDDMLRPGQLLTLKISYTGRIREGHFGLYQNIYRDKERKRKIAAVTQMEPYHARKMVPCFDEPEYKASWTVTVVHPNGTTAITNAKEVDVTAIEGGTWKVSTFQSTPVMSSYLLAIIVSEFDFDETRTKRNVRIRVWSAPDGKKLRRHALWAAKSALHHFEEYFGINEVMPKQDLVALENFAAGAMENWGLITFRKNVLLGSYHMTYAEAMESETVVAHELTHQWFGNLVTIKWWEEIFLNEGFAAYFQNTKLDVSGFELKENMVLWDKHKAIKEDDVAASRPLSSIIENNEEIDDSFDTISYEKGAAIVGMVRTVIGDENFRKGITNYLKKNSFKNTQGEDLWNAFDEVMQKVQGPGNTALNISDFGSQWTKQMGFPLVHVHLHNSTTLKITQRRFLLGKTILGPRKYRSPRYGYKWDVPLWLKTKMGRIELKWLERNKPLYVGTDLLAWPPVVNLQRLGYYRQNFDRNIWENFIQQLHENHEAFDLATRYSLIDDAFYAALIFELDYEVVFKLLRSVTKENNYVVWRMIGDNFIQIRSFYDDEPEFWQFRDYAKLLFAEQYDKAEKRFNEEMSKDYNDSYMVDPNSVTRAKQPISGRIMELAFKQEFEEFIFKEFCELGLKKCREGFQRLFEKKILRQCNNDEQASHCVRIPAHLKGRTYCEGVRKMGKTAYEKVERLLNNEEDENEKKKLAQGLSCVEKVEALKKSLLKALKGKSPEYITATFTSVAQNKLSHEFLLTFFIDNWGIISERLKDYKGNLRSVIVSCLRTIRSDVQIMMARNFLENTPHVNRINVFEQELERAEHFLMWKRKLSKRVSELLKSELQRIQSEKKN